MKIDQSIDLFLSHYFSQPSVWLLIV